MTFLGILCYYWLIAWSNRKLLIIFNSRSMEWNCLVSHLSSVPPISQTWDSCYQFPNQKFLLNCIFQSLWELHLHNCMIQSIWDIPVPMGVALHKCIFPRELHNKLITVYRMQICGRKRHLNGIFPSHSRHEASQIILVTVHHLHSLSVVNINNMGDCYRPCELPKDLWVSLTRTANLTVGAQK